jgi:teichuronic acid biosynthesis glycosyltransferase TuaC
MNVLFISPYTDFGQPTPYIQSQAGSLRNLGINVTEFHLTDRGLKAHIKFFFRIRAFLKNKQFDIIHAHFGYLAMWTYVWSSRSKFVVSFMGEDLYGLLNKKLKQSIQGRFNKILASFLQSRADWIIVKSNHMFSFIKPEYKAKTTVIPNGVDFNAFPLIDQQLAKQKLQWDTKKRQVLFLGKKNMFRKNFKLVENACALLNDNNIELIAPYPINTKKVYLYMNACDCLVFSSLEEGSPNVIKEAIVCNSPIVTTNVGDTAERINNIDGCYLAGYDPQDFMINIRKALNFSKRTKGREASAYLDHTHAAQKIAVIYQSLISNKSKNDSTI